MMGIGEPLDNYDEVIRFLRLVNLEGGLAIGYRHISLSSCGLVPQILRLADEGLPITLSISLHAATDERRSRIMPVNRKWNIDALLTACADYYRKTSRRISFEYTLLAGQNDGENDARALAALLKKYMRGMPIHVNLIRVNEVKEREFKRGDAESARRFAEVLNALGVNATVRRRLGSDIDGACGQLRRRHGKEEQ
jgi:23S rRNA (adenine2503-C2)-methyltransferase